MQALIRVAALLAAAAAGLALVKRRNSRQDEDDPHVVLLRDEDAVISAADVSNVPEEPARHHTVPARVRTCYRRMNPLTLTGANEAVFQLDNGEEIKLNFSGEGGLHLKEGDRGLLTWQGLGLIRFEKENGDVIGGMFYAPAGEEIHE